MGIINECMLNQQKSKVPSQIIITQGFYENIEQNRKNWENSPLYNEYLKKQCYRTQIIQPSQKNSEIYLKMNKMSQPPSQLFQKIKDLREQQFVREKNRKMRNGKGIQSYSQTVNRPKFTKRSAQPMSQQPLKTGEKSQRFDNNLLNLQQIDEIHETAY